MVTEEQQGQSKPEPTEFIKRLRQAIECWDTYQDIGHEACDRIESQAKEIKRLKKMYRELEVKSDATGAELGRIQKLIQALKGENDD